MAQAVPVPVEIPLDPYLQLVADFSPALAAGVVLAVFVMVILLRALGFRGIADREKLVDEKKITTVNTGVDEIKGQLTGIDRRLGAVEFDLANRPTRDDIYKLGLSQVEIKGELRATNQTVQSTAAAIARLEEGVYEAARRFAEREASLTVREQQLRAREEAMEGRLRSSEGGGKNV